MANEDFTGYTEEDPNSHITVIASKVSWDDLDRNEDAYVYNDKGVNHFNGDFEHLLEIYMGPTYDSGGLAHYWMLSNDIDDYVGLRTANKSCLNINSYRSGGTYSITLNELDAGSENESTWSGASKDTLYYCRVKRDESVGTYGTLYLDIYTSAADRTNEANAVANLSVTLNSSKKDFQYIFAVNTQNTGDAQDVDGYTQNLDLLEAVAVAPTAALDGPLVGPLGGPI